MFCLSQGHNKKVLFLRLDNKMDENNTNQTNNLFKRYVIICIHKM